MNSSHSKIFKKIITALVILAVILPFLAIEPKPTEAQLGNLQVSGLFVPVNDVPNTPAIQNNAIQNTMHTTKETVWDNIYYMIAKITIQNITNSIINWINSGFQGSPAFVGDPGKFLTDVGDQIAGEFIAGTELGFLCDPFQLDIRIALNLNYNATFKKRIGCTLTDVIKNVENFAKFTGGDFSQGGWDGWFSMTQNQQNNPYGAFASAKAELSLRTAKGQNIELLKLDWGEGFLSWQDCLQEDQNGKCIKKGPIQTPGSVVENQLNQTLFSGQRQLELADEFNEIVAALLSQLVQQVFVGGGLANAGANFTPSQDIAAYCFADKSHAATGENVRWEAQAVADGPVTYLWKGSAPLQGRTGASAIVKYTTIGEKSGQIEVTANLASGTKKVTVDCTNKVDVREQEVTAYCSPNKTQAYIGENVTWSANANTIIGGGVPSYMWTGSEPLGGLTGENVTVQYTTGGIKSGKINLTYAGNTTTYNCTQTVDVKVEPLAGYCASDKNTAAIGETVTWGAFVTGGYGTRTYVWNGSPPLGGQSTSTVSVQYQSPGVKDGQVTVQSGGLSKTFTCNTVFVGGF